MKNNLVVNCYQKIELNLGIKKILRQQCRRTKLFIDNKIVYPIFTKINQYIYKQSIKHYGADYKWNDQKSQNLDKKTNNYGYGLFHYAMIRNQKPKNILCVGSMYGYAPYMMARACQDNNFGKVDFVDANYSLSTAKNKKNHYFGQGFWQEENCKEHFKYLLDQKFIKTHVMTTKEFAKKFPQKKFDYVCLDGDHSYKGVKTDFDLFWRKTNKEGFLCFHDIHLDANFLNLEFSYKKFWQELIKDKRFKNKFELSNHYSGLGFLQKI